MTPFLRALQKMSQSAGVQIGMRADSGLPVDRDTTLWFDLTVADWNQLRELTDDIKQIRYLVSTMIDDGVEHPAIPRIVAELNTILGEK